MVEKSKAKPVADFNVTIHDVEILTGFKSLSLELVHHETESDKDMQLLKQHIVDGFPKTKSCLPEYIHCFFDYRECLMIIDGVIMKGKHIVIPASLREKLLIHFTVAIWVKPRLLKELGLYYSGPTCKGTLLSIWHHVTLVQSLKSNRSLNPLQMTFLWYHGTA